MIRWIPLCSSCAKSDETLLPLGPHRHPCERCDQMTDTAIRTGSDR